VGVHAAATHVPFAAQVPPFAHSLSEMHSCVSPVAHAVLHSVDSPAPPPPPKPPSGGILQQTSPPVQLTLLEHDLVVVVPVGQALALATHE
jgi:hypothetical protein